MPGRNHPERVKEANRWANLLPTAMRRRFAFDYLAWLNGGAVGVEPDPKGLARRFKDEIKEEIGKYRLWERHEDCTAPETCGVCHDCQRARPCPIHDGQKGGE